MANRFRNERIEIKLTKEEKEVFEKKMKLANCKTMSHFLRKIPSTLDNCLNLYKSLFYGTFPFTTIC